MLFPSPIPLPTAWQKRYQIARAIMYLFIGTGTVLFALRALFPTVTQSFDFRTPDSSKNDILAPRSLDQTPRTNGRIEARGTLMADTTVVGDFSLITVTAVLEKKSAVPETLPFTLRRGYQSFFYPTDTAVSSFPEETVYSIGGSYYALRADTLFPFVSEAAFRSRFPQEHALPGDAALLTKYPISETWLGFRVGSLLSNDNGVFVVTSETEVRPVGSADIFLALGYNFADVIPASEEELGVYQRGRILLLGAAHPDGTLLFDQDTDTYYMIDHGTKHPLEQPMPGSYLDFLTQDRHLHPVIVSSTASEQRVDCTLVPNFFVTALTCTAPLTALAPGFGNDFELQLQSSETDIDINSLALSFETAKNRENLLTLLSQMKHRLLARFSGAP